MTKDEFLVKLFSIEESMRELKKTYISENALYKVGERYILESTYYKNKPIQVEVSNVIVQYDGGFKYEFLKVKNDGNVSSSSAYVSIWSQSTDKLTKIPF